MESDRVELDGVDPRDRVDVSPPDVGEPEHDAEEAVRRGASMALDGKARKVRHIGDLSTFRNTAILCQGRFSCL